MWKLTPMRRRALLLGLLSAALGWPASALAATTAVSASPGSNPFVCLDVTAGTTSASGNVLAADGTVLETLVPQAPQAFACSGAAGNRIYLSEPSRRLSGVEGLTLRTQANNDPAPVSFRVPIARADPASGATGVTHVLALPTTSTVNGVVTAGPATDLTGLPAVTIAFTAGVPVTVNISPLRVYFYGNTRRGTTSVQINDPAPGIPATVELRLPDGTLVASRNLPVRLDGSSTYSEFDVGLPPGSTIRVAQAGILDRTRAFGDATITADGFNLALPAAPGCNASTCPTARYYPSFALHGDATALADPLGPCRELAYLGTLSASCTPLTTPRTSLTATGLLPVGGDSIDLDVDWPNRDTMNSTAIQRGASIDLDYGAVFVGGAATGPLTGTITVPQGGAAPLQLVRTLGSESAGESSQVFDGQSGFPVHIPSGTTGLFSGPAIGAAPLSATFQLSAAIEGTDLTGRAAAGARIRVTRALATGFSLPDISGVASPDGSFRLALGTAATGTSLKVSAGDPATRSLTQLSLTIGRTHIGIAGATDRQVVRGTITLTATGDLTGPALWSVGTIRSFAVTAPWTRPLDTRAYADGPLKVLVSDASTTNGASPSSYLYLIVDNTAPSGGAGADQTVRPRRDALILTDARDANGLASVVADFGDGVKLTQPASQLGQPFHHAYAKVGGYKVTVTITDAAGNVTTDTATVKVRTAAAPRLKGTVPLSASRARPLKLTLGASAPGTLTVRLVSPRGRTLRTAVKRIARAGGTVKISFVTRSLPKGRYLLLRQVVSDGGTPGAIVTSSLVIR